MDLFSMTFGEALGQMRMHRSVRTFPMIETGDYIRLKTDKNGNEQLIHADGREYVPSQADLLWYRWRVYNLKLCFTDILPFIYHFHVVKRADKEIFISLSYDNGKYTLNQLDPNTSCFMEKDGHYVQYNLTADDLLANWIVIDDAYTDLKGMIKKYHVD